MIDPNLVWAGAVAAGVLVPATGVLIYQRVKSRQRKLPAAQAPLLRLQQRRR